MTGIVSFEHERRQHAEIREKKRYFVHAYRRVIGGDDCQQAMNLLARECKGTERNEGVMP